MTEAKRNAQHVAQTRLYIERIFSIVGIERLSDVNPSAIVPALTLFRGQRKATRTIEAHVTAVKAFSMWAWRDGRTVDYTLNGLAKPNDPKDRRRVRRPLSDAELRTLIETTRTAPTWRNITGLDRSMLYGIAAMSGLRRDELLSLTPESFRLDGPTPMVVCEAGYTKNGEKAEQPLPDALVSTLRPWLATKAARQPLFAAPAFERTGMMLKIDLARCGFRSRIAAGRVVDLHSLRHGYISSLANAGTPIKTLQTLARHADPRLTLNTYSHVSLFDTG